MSEKVYCILVPEDGIVAHNVALDPLKEHFHIDMHQRDFGWVGKASNQDTYYAIPKSYYKTFCSFDFVYNAVYIRHYYSYENKEERYNLEICPIDLKNGDFVNSVDRDYLSYYHAELLDPFLLKHSDSIQTEKLWDNQARIAMENIRNISRSCRMNFFTDTELKVLDRQLGIVQDPNKTEEGVAQWADLHAEVKNEIERRKNAGV